ncbi:MAG TPA: cytochrome b N-terminal domain-containing protein [Anaerolineales bacterium]|nr:cytochrome b N-terminal domain-containing protein [Anaerolineales bacterium]
MKITFRRTYLVAILGVLMAIFLLFGMTGDSQAGPASPENQPAGDTPIDWDQAQEILSENFHQLLPSKYTAASLPPPEQDPCLHCHITGENKGLWTPLVRWVFFGGAGLIFAFGIYRSSSVWVTRSPWKPILSRTADWFDTRYEISDPLSKFLSKPVPNFARRWWYCLGGITAFLFVLQGLTGIMLAFYYKPTPEQAFSSIQFIETQVNFGSAVRMIHHWSANGMILMCTAHMIRVFIMGAYKKPREFNWISGVLLLMLTLGFGLTGYLLPWDQRAFWATTVATEIGGAIPVIGDLVLVFARVGWDIAAETLTRFYALHILILPLVTIGSMGAHFLMVRRQGIAKPL